MFAALQNLPLVLLLLIATTLEVGGDAVVRIAIYQQTGLVRAAWFLGGAALLFGYGAFLNSARLPFVAAITYLGGGYADHCGRTYRYLLALGVGGPGFDSCRLPA
jgi:hypothetical protein